MSTHNPMDPAPLIPLRPSISTFGLARAQLSKVLRRARHHVVEELEFDAAQRFAAEGHVEETDGVAVGEEGV